MFSPQSGVARSSGVEVRGICAFCGTAIPFASLRSGLGVFFHRITGEDARATKTSKTAPEERQKLAHGVSHGLKVTPHTPTLFPAEREGTAARWVRARFPRLEFTPTKWVAVGYCLSALRAFGKKIRTPVPRGGAADTNAPINKKEAKNAGSEARRYKNIIRKRTGVASTENAEARRQESEARRREGRAVKKQ